MGRVYFVQEDGSGAIKIGWADKLRQTFTDMRAYYPYDLKLLASFEGILGDERIVQEQFKHINIKDDWFRPEPDLMELIAKNRVIDTPFDLAQAVWEFGGKSTTEAGRECRKLFEVVEYPQAKEELLTVEEAAAALGCSAQTLRNYEKKGIFIPARSEGGHRRYKRSDIMTLRKQQMIGCEFIIPGIVVNDLWSMIQKMLASFDPMEKIDISICQDTVLNKVKLTIDAADGLNSITKLFSVKE